MMGTDRVSIKLDAKSKITPEVKKVTLIFLVINTLIPNLISSIYGTFFVTDVVNEVIYEADYLNILKSTFFSHGFIGIYVIGLLLGFIFSIFSFGYYAYSMKVARSQQTGGIQEIFSMLGQWKKIILLTLWMELFIFLWSLLFVIPGIIAAYRYRMAPYILIDNPEIGVREAVRRSKEMMVGYKMELFVFDLSFFGWLILASLIGSIGTAIGDLIAIPVLSVILEFVFLCIMMRWLQGYMSVAEANFYDVVSGQMHYHGGEDTQNQSFWSEPEYNSYSAPESGPVDSDDPWN